METTSDLDLRTLVELGLTGYEATAYVALTRRGQATASEIARLSELPRQRIYDVLEALVARGLASKRHGRPARFAPADPTDAVANLLAARRAELERLERVASDTAARLTPGYEESQRGDKLLEYIEILRDPFAIATRFAQLETSTEHEILVFTKPPYAVEPSENLAGLELLRRGVRARSVYERSVDDDAAQVAVIREFVVAGEEARIVDTLPLKLLVIDERVAVFTLADPGAQTPSLTIMIVEHVELAALLKLAFERVWESAEPFA